MTEAGTVLLTLACIALSLGVFLFVAENGRLPATQRRWQPYINATSDYRGSAGVSVGIRRRGRYLSLTVLDPNATDFDEQLATAETFARERCIMLNGSETVLRRKLPR
jgi:hypothetical protein